MPDLLYDRLREAASFPDPLETMVVVRTLPAEMHFRCERSELLLFSGRIFAQCLKITEKVSFNIASEASHVYICSDQNLIENVK